MPKEQVEFNVNGNVVQLAYKTNRDGSFGFKAGEEDFDVNARLNDSPAGNFLVCKFFIPKFRGLTDTNFSSPHTPHNNSPRSQCALIDQTLV